MTWAELIRVLRDHGFQPLKTGRGSHRQFWNPTTKRIVTIAVHTRKDVGKGLASRILKDAGIKESEDGRR